MRSLILIPVLLLSSFTVEAHQWGGDASRCEKIEAGISSATMLHGRVLHDAIEHCDLSRLPDLMNNAIESMEQVINNELIRRGRTPIIKDGQ